MGREIVSPKLYEQANGDLELVKHQGSGTSGGSVGEAHLCVFICFLYLFSSDSGGDKGSG